MAIVTLVRSGVGILGIAVDWQLTVSLLVRALVPRPGPVDGGLAIGHSITVSEGATCNLRRWRRGFPTGLGVLFVWGKTPCNVLILFALKPHQTPMNIRRHAQAGFTLIELLVVIIIVGILASLAFPAYSGMVRRARYSEAKQHLGSMARELQTYHLEKSQYPPDVGGNVKPEGIDSWPTKVPYDSFYDYDHWSVGNNQCYVQIAFAGEDGLGNYPKHTLNKKPPGFMEIEDNLILGVDLYDCEQGGSGPVK